MQKWHKWSDGSWHEFAEESAQGIFKRKAKEVTKALHLAVSMVDVDGIRLALEDPTCPKSAILVDSPGRCILHNLGAGLNSVTPPPGPSLDEAIALLTSRGASLETQGAPDWTSPLGQAVVRGDLATVSALARAGASLDTTISKRGRTLEQAAQFYLSWDTRIQRAMLQLIAELHASCV